ncbi:MAG: hypothetical protein KBD76_13270 [Bacteriovorax sp.]|jgi:hypothetical protein|nr:hypothetical protein [Bacteriovorax sp.]
MKTKKILHRIRWFIYTGFLIISIKLFGLYRFAVESINDKADYVSSPKYKDVGNNLPNLSLNREIQSLQDSILDLRRSQISSGDLYNFDEYIFDLAQINLLEIQNGFAPNGSGQVLNNPLLELYNEAVRNGDNHSPTEQERQDAENIYASITGIQEWISDRSPDWDETFDSEVPSFSWNDFFSWSSRKYFKFFPLIFLLYSFWFFVDGKVSKFMRRNPFSFVLAAALYPIVIFMLIRDLFVTKARSVIAEADYRRTKDEFFSVLSKDELGRIKDFARSSRKLFEWRKELKDEGKIFKHSFVLVLSFTIFLGFMFRSTSVCAETKSDKRTEIYQFVKEKTDSTVSVLDFQPLDEGVLPDIIPWPRLLSQKIKFINKSYILENGFIPDVGHIPNSVSNF